MRLEYGVRIGRQIFMLGLLKFGYDEHSSVMVFRWYNLKSLRMHTEIVLLAVEFLIRGYKRLSFFHLHNVLFNVRAEYFRLLLTQFLIHIKNGDYDYDIHYITQAYFLFT